MKKISRHISLAKLILLIFFGGFIYVALNKFLFQIETDEPNIEFKGIDLISLMSASEDFNDSLYIDKLVRVEGIVEEINDLNRRQTIILEGDSKTLKSVICDMHNSQNHSLAEIKVGDTIWVQGIYKGYLNDIILLNCMIYQN